MFKWLEKNLPKIVIAPSIGLISWFVYGFILWTFYISFTNSKILPKYELWGVQQYVKLWGLRKWHIGSRKSSYLYNSFCGHLHHNRGSACYFIRSENKVGGFS